MAGGIEWFRWHHGSVTDPKFQLVARKAKASLPDVIAIWAYVLEQASASEVRGEFVIDAEAVDCMFGFDDGTTLAVLESMTARGLLVDGCKVASWSKRQPKRERPDDVTATERKRHQRQRDMAAKSPVTPSHTTSRQVTPRGEERRVEENNSLSPPGEPEAKATPPLGGEPAIPTIAPNDPEDDPPATPIDPFVATLESLPDDVHSLWWDWVQAYEDRYGFMPVVQKEAVLMELMRRGQNMKADLELSILKGSKSILDHTSQFGSSGGRGANRKTKGEQIRQESGY